MVFLCDDLLKVRDKATAAAAAAAGGVLTTEKEKKKPCQFFPDGRLASHGAADGGPVPLVCLDLGKTVYSPKHSEPAFKKLARHLITEENRRE